MSAGAHQAKVCGGCSGEEDRGKRALPTRLNKHGGGPRWKDDGIGEGGWSRSSSYITIILPLLL